MSSQPPNPIVPKPTGDLRPYVKGRRAISLALLALAPLMVLMLAQTFSRQLDRDIKHGRIDPQIVGNGRAR